jgi:menaquinone-dependent protoporphyrinogen oxidase
MKILIAYGTKHGSTAEVAEQVATVMREAGCSVDVLPARDADGVERYDGVIVGGALYTGRWHGDARHFLKHHRRELASTPLAVFAMGPLKDEPEELEGSRRQLEKALAGLPDLEPFSIAVFGGVVDPAKLHFPFNHMPAGDARDPHAIRAWARQVLAAFEAQADAA